jgi:choline dehydrogenase-like flavoprotein
MSLSNDLANELTKLAGFASTVPRTVALTDANQITLAVDFSAVDSMSCSFCELRLSVPSLVACDVDVLRQWAQALSARVTYLLENLGPVEIDTTSGKVLVRSTPPDQQPDGTKYFEVLLESSTTGNFTLRRYESIKGTPGRTPVDIQTTHEVLLKLVGDLVDTVPTP